MTTVFSSHEKHADVNIQLVSLWHYILKTDQMANIATFHPEG